ncbi:MAG TPA: OmpW family outer membrane protein [Burkholderiales bacterium]|nr:OmpW family outer membrane protein [Burkholderiales bacterium]
MKITTPIAMLAALLALAAWTGRAGAAEGERNNSLRLGMYFIHYQASADDLSGPFVPAGANLDVRDTQTPYFAYVRRLSREFELEFAAGLPPTTETVGRGPATLGSVPFNNQVIATAKWFSPTLLVNYKFSEGSSGWNPYVGVGINYTHFFDRKSTAAGDAVGGGPTTLSLSNSVGPAATIGASYYLQDNWNMYLSYSVSRVKSKLEANTSGTVRSTTINFNPSALVLSFGYSF